MGRMAMAAELGRAVGLTPRRGLGLVFGSALDAAREAKGPVPRALVEELVAGWEADHGPCDCWRSVEVYAQGMDAARVLFAGGDPEEDGDDVIPLEVAPDGGADGPLPDPAADALGYLSVVESALDGLADEFGEPGSPRDSYVRLDKVTGRVDVAASFGAKGWPAPQPPSPASRGMTAPKTPEQAARDRGVYRGFPVVTSRHERPADDHPATVGNRTGFVKLTPCGVRGCPVCCPTDGAKAG